MKSKILLTILSINALISINTNAKTNWITDTVYIKGNVINFNKLTDNKTVQFYFKNDLTNRKGQNIYTAKIDNRGGFGMKVPVMFSLDFTIDYKSHQNFICAPGDSLCIEVENNKINVANGTRKVDNELLKKFIQNLPNKKHYDETRDFALTQKLPDDFKDYIEHREFEFKTYWDGFKKANKTTSFFNAWADDYIKYKTLSDLMIYPSCYAREHLIEMDSLKLPNDYYDFLDKTDINDLAFITGAHADFLALYQRWLIEYPVDSAKSAEHHFCNENIIAGGKILLKMIIQKASGFTKELALTRFYLDAIEGKQLIEFEELYDSTLITYPFFKNIITEKHSDLKKYMANQITVGANLRSINDTIITKYTGKVIYIDFWAPWCSPCMGEMPFSKQLQEEFKNKDVVFLYLASRCTESSWKSTIANEKITGEHILLTKDQYATLASEFGITGIPHYVLIDKNGNIVSKSAPRPSQKAKIAKSINDLL